VANYSPLAAVRPATPQASVTFPCHPQISQESEGEEVKIALNRYFLSWRTAGSRLKIPSSRLIAEGYSQKGLMENAPRN